MVAIAISEIRAIMYKYEKDMLPEARRIPPQPHLERAVGV